MKIRRTLSFLSTIVLLSCNNNNNSHQPEHATQAIQNGMRIIQENTWGGDFEIPFINREFVEDSLVKYSVSSAYNNTPVGFDLFMKTNKKEFFWDGIILKSTGAKSDNFLRILASVYQVKVDTSSLYFADSVKVTYAVLESKETAKPGNWAAAQYKLFFDGGEHELYMNIQAQNIIQFPEKDSSYRRGIIMALSKSKQ